MQVHARTYTHAHTRHMLLFVTAWLLCWHQVCSPTCAHAVMCTCSDVCAHALCLCVCGGNAMSTTTGPIIVTPGRLVRVRAGVRIEACNFTRLDSSAVTLSGYTRDVQILRNSFYLIGGNTISLMGKACTPHIIPSWARPVPYLYTTHHTIVLVRFFKMVPTVVV